jgi:hypothetical protein
VADPPASLLGNHVAETALGLSPTQAASSPGDTAALRALDSVLAQKGDWLAPEVDSLLSTPKK